MASTPRETASWLLTRRLFLGGVALCFLIAFASLGVQVRGLFGARGIAPLAEHMQLLAQHLRELERLRAPTLFWLGASDAVLAGAVWVGGVAAGLALLGVLPRVLLFLCWALYLSFVSVGSPFLSFQWDALLLEAGLLAVLWAPFGLRPFGHGEGAPSDAVRWLLYALLFKLMFLSGAVKLLSGDEAWKDGSALEFHYWTQPLPHRLSVFVAEAPRWFQRASVFVMFTIELGLPCLLLVPVGRRRLRQIVAAGTVALMLAIFLTGNYGFFNLLTAVLALPLLDDRAWSQVFPAPAAPSPTPRWRTLALGLLCLPLAVVSAARFARELGWLRTPPAPVVRLEEALAPLSSVNSYGLFRVMTTERLEIRIEGSTDGTTWRPYRFRYKPDDPRRAPVFAGLHMPRLDWQLWFVPLSPQRAGWLVDFVDRLLEGSPDVLALLGENPFAEAPPRAVRAELAPYRFASPAERTRGTYWQRGPAWPFLAPRSAAR